MNLSAQEYLAKLLAKENLSVQHGNYSTASFDVLNRVLRLPLWEDKGKDVYDLLVGHEVGHALYTPADGWHDSEKKIGKIPRAYLNIVEDIRIERKIQETYPGIVRRFKNGYKKLFNDNLFGTDDRDINEAGLMDRLNVHSKGRGYIPVEFSDEETPLVEEAMKVETWDDVVNVCKKFYDFVEENKEEEDEMPEGTGADFPSNDMDGDDEVETENPKGTTPPEDDDDDQESEGGKGDGEGDGEKDKAPVEPGHETFTDDTFRENEENLLDKETDRYDNNRQSQFSSGISDVNLKNMLFTYKEAEAAREKFMVEKLTERDYEYCAYVSHKCKEDWNKSKAGYNSTAKLLAKDFERKKAAFEYSKATTAKSGKLDPLKLHSYKMTEDIFLTTTKLAQAKSHGIIMFLDLSGSMCEIIEDVMAQAITIAMFCRKVNIPFEAYSFTTTSYYSDDIRPEVTLAEGEMDIKGAKIVEMFSSYMNNKTFDEASFTMFAVSKAHSYSRQIPYYMSSRELSKIDQMGSTPLVQTCMLASRLTKAFVKKHGIQNTNLMFLTDGAPDGIYIEEDKHADVKTHSGKKTINFDGKLIKADGSREMYKNMLGRLKELTGATIMGFHLATDASSFGQGIYGIKDDDPYNDYLDFQTMIKKWRKEGFSEFKKAKGYDNYFVIKINKKVTDDEFVLPDGKTELKDIKREFKKFNRTKKTTKQLVGKITDAVAA